jgi:hypothetical protein
MKTLFALISMAGLAIGPFAAVWPWPGSGGGAGGGSATNAVSTIRTNDAIAKSGATSLVFTNPSGGNVTFSATTVGAAVHVSANSSGGSGSLGVRTNSTGVTTNPPALIFNDTGNVKPTVSSNANGATFTFNTDPNLSLNSLTLTGSGGYMWTGLGTNAVVSNGTNYVFDFANGDHQWMVPTENVNIMFATNGSTNTLYGKSAAATLTIDLRGKAFTCRLSFPTGWYRIGALTTNNALLTTNTLNKIAFEGTDAAANTIVTNTSLATGYGQ